MAKKTFQNEVSIIWDFITCAALYAAICYFNGPDKQHEMPQDQVHRIAMIICVAWFFITIIILRKQGTKVVLFRHKKPKDGLKEAAGEAVKNAAETAGKAAAAKALEDAAKAVASEGGSAPAPRPTYILEDPATGAQRLFIQDENGQWVSEDGQSILNMDGVDDWKQQRQADREWQDDANQVMKDRESAIDRKLRELDEELAKEQKRIDDDLAATLKRIEKYGTMDDDVEHIKEILRRQQRLDQIEADRQYRKGIAADVGYKAANVTKYATDKAFDVIGKTGGTAGKVGKAIYTGLTDQAGAVTEAVLDGKDAWQASKKAAVDTMVTVTEDQFSGGSKMVANTAGETVREMGKAYVDGKSGMEIAKAGVKGFEKGLNKANVEIWSEAAGEYLNDGGSFMSTDAGGNITEIFVDDGDIAGQLMSDVGNKLNDMAFEEAPKKRK